MQTAHTETRRRRHSETPCKNPFTCLHVLWCALCIVTLFAGGARGGQPPSDVRSNHWAAPAVTRALQAGLLRVQADGRFHGDAKVTRMEVLLAIGKLGRALTEGTWKPASPSRPVPDTVSAVWEKTDWKTEPVRRYAFASIMTRFADYVENALPRPAPDAAVGKTVVLPAVTIKQPSSSPAFEPLTYLAHNRMIKPDSPLLKPDGPSLSGGELSRALADLAAGVNDRLTDLGKTADGSTPDAATKPAPR